MKRLLYIGLLLLLILPAMSSCEQADDDFFAGRTWYITGLCQGSIKNNLLWQYGTDGKPSTSLSQAWQTDVLSSSEARYCIKFDDKNSFTLQTERRTWRGTVSYDLSSRKFKFTMLGTNASSDLEKETLKFLQNVESYSGNNSYLHLNCKIGDFILLYPTRGNASDSQK